MTTDNNNSTVILHTNRQYVDHVRSSTNNTTTLLHHSISFEQESPTKTLSNNLNSNNHHNTINVFDDDEDENNTHNLHCPHHRTADPSIIADPEQVLNESKADIHNLSDYSLAPKRLMTTFEDTYSKDKQMEHCNHHNLKQPQPNASPTDVKSFNENNNNSNSSNSKKSNNNNNKLTEDSLSDYKMDLPHFHLTEKLSLTLPQPTIDRISFYGVVYGVNHQIHEMARGDHHNPIEDTTTPSNEEESPLVHAVVGPNPTPKSHSVPSQQGQVAILDEEEFLLAVIRSRTPEEKAIRDCPTSFAEAIGEVEVDVIRENGQTPNPLSVLAPSRTQLWKPSRSWWEAKSGKNPWIEPKNHNKRWRYLWPLIHYHKFLAKCIKKLKRNSVDVKTCLSPVSTFLRSEVCAVSNHLASSSRFTSEQWMDGLPDFHGWIPKDVPTEQRIRNLVAGLPIRSLGEPVSWKSPQLRNQIDECFSLAMEADRGQMVVDGFGEGRVREERFDSSEEYPVVGYGRERVGSSSTNSTSNGGEVGYTRPPKGKPPKKIPGSATKQRRPKKRIPDMNAMNGRYSNNAMARWNQPGHQMMPPPSHMQHGMYPPQYTNHYAGQPPPPNAYPIGNTYPFGNGLNAPPNMYRGSDDYPTHPQAEWSAHHMNADNYYYNRWDQQRMGNDVQYFHQPTNGPIANWTSHEEAPQLHYPEQPPQTYNPTSLIDTSSETNELPEEAPDTTLITNSTLTEGSRRDFLQTPSKPRYNANDEINPSPYPPDSPYWAHLGFTTLAMSGLATPRSNTQRAASPLTRVDVGELGGGGGNSGRTFGIGRRMESAVAQASKPLLLNTPYSYHHQGNAMNVPPSPATQFLMSPQPNSRTTAFFAQTQMNPTFPPASPHHHSHHHHPSQHHPIQEQVAVQQQNCVPDSPEPLERTKKGAVTPQRVVESEETVDVQEEEEASDEDKKGGME